MSEVLFITSYPPRECGIATYSEDLIEALQSKFKDSFTVSICALEEGLSNHTYPQPPLYVLNTESESSFQKLAFQVNKNAAISMVLIQHEFGFFHRKEAAFNHFLKALTKPIAVVYHTVLPAPNAKLKASVQNISAQAKTIIVMTQTSTRTLVDDYAVAEDKIRVIPHGTHLVKHSSKSLLKEKYGLEGKQVLSTFGLISAGKGIDTTLDALPAIIAKNPDIMFLVIGKTHPGVVRSEGERYREMLMTKVVELKLEQHVTFINRYLPLPDLLEYLQLTDIYLFTSKDPAQAVSGTFSYAMSCGCPVISTPIPHAKEVLQGDAGIIIDFDAPKQLAAAANSLLSNHQLRQNISSNALHLMAPTAWQNSAIAHAEVFSDMMGDGLNLAYTLPAINLDHLRNMTTGRGMIQFSKLHRPDIDSGYTLDDNARALVAMCQHYTLTGSEDDLVYLHRYANFIAYCQQSDGMFLNYVDEKGHFTPQNKTTNLEDANGRAIWALGHLSSLRGRVAPSLIVLANRTLQRVLPHVNHIHSTRAMAFIIKGLYYHNLSQPSEENTAIIIQMADRLVQMYRHEADAQWPWFEGYFTYANSILPEALLCAWQATGKPIYKEIARNSFYFLLSKTFKGNAIQVVSNHGWLHKDSTNSDRLMGGEQPIDVAYTILALSRFYTVFKDEEYKKKMHGAFNWFLGANALHRIIYNPCTGGCYDGLEHDSVNLNQGAESTVSYLMARLTMEQHLQRAPKKVLRIAEHRLGWIKPAMQREQRVAV